MKGQEPHPGPPFLRKGKFFGKLFFVASARLRRPFNLATRAITELKGRTALRYNWIVKQNASVACFSPAQSTRSTLITRPAILARVCGGDSGAARGTSVPDVGNYRRDLSCRFLDISGGHMSAGSLPKVLKVLFENLGKNLRKKVRISV